MTFTINGTDFSGYITKYGYETAVIPVFAESVQTLDGVEHTAIIRYKGQVHITIRPLTGSEWSTLHTALSQGILTVVYYCIQRNTNITAYMRLDEMSAEKVLENASRTLYGNTDITFVEL